ncbi:MAG: GH92 family glycosyl hydrolase [Candidatus Aminicenantes bacterium]|nr:GH92 family glycosyl hydrolase [Candidatus Aminicenantes bacterium]
MFLLFLWIGSQCKLSKEKDFAFWVDPFIGTGAHGHTYPGAVLPFGMVQLSPDTRLTGWDGCSGYHHSDNTIYGFSHTHLSGTGIPDYGDILFMPTTGDILLQSGYPDEKKSGYGSLFSHHKEKASPGFYAVHLDDYGIDVELTVTKRAGFHKYIFPESDRSNILIDLTHRDQVIESSINIIDDSTIEGMRRSSAWAKDQIVYFAARFSRPFDEKAIAVNNEIQNGSLSASGKDLKAIVSYKTKEKEKILVKVGISAVSIEGAWKNLKAEIDHWDFNRTRSQAYEEWNRSLRKISISTRSEDKKRIFYTALYHTLLNPNIYMDVDGKFRGMDRKIHQADNFEYYTVFSLWDTFRAAHPLFTLIETERSKDFIQTLISQYEHGGKLPMWELSANYTGCMIGYHAVPVIVDAFVKGIDDFDVDRAYESMKKSAEQDHLGLKYYQQLGFIPADKESESVSKTLEYAYDDWCIAQMAKILHKADDYREYIQRAQSYKNLFDPSSGFMRPRYHGTWITPFDPAEVNFNFTEANSWQYSFFVPQDIEGLIELMGGKRSFAQKLDDLFTADQRLTGRDQADITGLIGQYAHGNEPSHHMAYLYGYAGMPWKTQQRVHEIMETMYTSEPGGLCGNEDCGQMSAWYIFGALGFYPVCPGQGIYVLGTPLFETAVINLENNQKFILKAEGISSKNIYIQEARLNGEIITRSYLKHDEIIRGGELVFLMGAEPNLKRGRDIEDIPSSAIRDHLIQPVPFARADSRTFEKSLSVGLGSVMPEAKIYYSEADETPSVHSSLYLKPIILEQSKVLNFFSVAEGLPDSGTVSSRFDRIPSGRKIQLKTTFSPQYPAGGVSALIDNLRGSADFKTGSWQGYHGVDLIAVVDLIQPQEILKISAGFLQDQNSWIFMPEEVEFAHSLDGENFHILSVIKNDISPREGEVIVRDFTYVSDAVKTRYVRIHAKNRGVCPPWHKGAGEKAWIFADEIIIE